jgi:starch synthase
MRVGLLTKEYPPDIYGGAGVHVEYLGRELRGLVDLQVHCFGAPRNEPGVFGHGIPAGLQTANAALQTLGTDVQIAAAAGGCDIVHSHTWYANMAGHLAKLQHGIPHVATTHSLEPDRPWKAEQLGGGYRVSSWCERTALEGADAVIAVSAGMRLDVLAAYPDLDPDRLHVITNGIDTGEYRPATAERSAQAMRQHGIDPDRPYALFVGRITRQKGVPHLLRAAHDLPSEAQLVLCAGAPDTPELAAEVSALVEGLAAHRDGVIWIEQMLPRPDVIALLSAATIFVCPSVYEPLGIVNLEAMACGTAVVASAVGGIPEVVTEGATGLLVPAGDEPALATAMANLLVNPRRAEAMGKAGRERAVEHFGWPAIARRTAQLYQSLLASV